MLLSDQDIRIMMQSGHLLIDPQPPDDSERFQPASIDLRLDAKLWIPKPDIPASNIPQLEEFDFDDYIARYTNEVSLEVSGGLLLAPGSFVIGRTFETVGLSNLLSTVGAS